MTPSPYNPSIVKIFLRVTFPAWFVVVPVCLLLRFLTLPFWFIGRMFQKKPTVSTEYSVQTAGPSESIAKDTILLVHGWPDCGKLWDKQVEALTQQGYRCLIVTGPGFQKGETAGTYGISHEEMGLKLKMVIENNTTSKKVTLLLHDWGCLWGYTLQAKCPSMVKRIIALDIGGIQEPDVATKLFFLSYQNYNVVAFMLGGLLGGFMNKAFLKLANYKSRPLSECPSTLNFPYFHMQKKVWTFNYQQNLYPHRSVPVAYGHGLLKPVPFHGPSWITELEATQNCETKTFDCDHWIPTHKPEELNAWLLQWLEKTRGV
eukprot:TRINITY_DN4767_c1_g1_i1.p1 TRINITY_DN4767_c1_g1~~TRINITY_DN4767_c1_g1_i1.p1  ORF type:complete len:317 (+),score=35.19 TRINITY_DN4767_c1_g1_i1:60-1010(+)